MVLAGLLMAAFVATAAVVPVLISPSDPVPDAAAPSSSPSAAAPVPTSVVPALTSAPPSPTPSASPSPTPPSFLVRPVVRARPLKTPPKRVFAEFQSVCGIVRQGSKAPLAGLAAAGRKVQYQFGGSSSASLPDPGDLPSSDTSCVDVGDRSTYWLPVVRRGGKILVPENLTAFYKAGVDDYTSVQPFPTGLRMVMGGPDGSGLAPYWAQVSWSCPGYDEPRLPASCPDGQPLTMRLVAPSCWDGRHLDVPGHRTHLTWPNAGRCPGGHPVVLPQVLVTAVYPLSGSGKLTVDSGPADDFGLGFVTNWKSARLKTLVKHCINGGRRCDTSGDGPIFPG